MNRMPIIKRKMRRGFSLMEIILALLVVSIGIVAVIGLLGTSLDGSAKAHDDLDVVSFSDLVLNYCHSVTDWNDISTNGTMLVPGYDGSTNALPIGSLAQFKVQDFNFENHHQHLYTVSYILDIAEFRNTKEITLRVWPGLSTNGSERIFYTEIYNWGKK